MITSNKGGLKEGRIVQTGIEFNTSFFNCQGTFKQGVLEPIHSFIGNKSEEVIITSIKRAENSEHKIIRAYETYSDDVEDAFEGLKDSNIMEVNLLEEQMGKVQEIKYKGFDIKTFIIKGVERYVKVK